MNRVPENQTVSYTTYTIAVSEAARLPIDFMKANAARVDRAFNMGEPISFIVEELRMIYSLRRPQPSKTPRQLAVRVVVAA